MKLSSSKKLNIPKKSSENAIGMQDNAPNENKANIISFGSFSILSTNQIIVKNINGGIIADKVKNT